MMHVSPERSRQIADQVLEYERMIRDANGGKSNIWESVREALRADGLTGADLSAEVGKLKAAVTIFCRNELDPLKAEKAEEKQLGAEEYVQAINMATPSHVHVHTRETATEIPEPPASCRTGSSKARVTQAAASKPNRDPRPGVDAAATQSTVSHGATDTRNAQDDEPDSGIEAQSGGETSEAPAALGDGADDVNDAPPPRPPILAGSGKGAAAAVVTLAKRVVSNPEICDGAPVIDGTSIQTSTIRQYAEDGWEPEAIIQEYPALTRLDIAAALQFEAMQRAKEHHAELTDQDPASPDYDPLAIPKFLRRTA